MRRRYRSALTPLRIDVDRGRPLSMKELGRRAARAHRRIRWLRQWRSPSGRGWHILLAVSPAPTTPMETVALQLLFGSDPYREAYNSNRALAVEGGEVSRFFRTRWNVLYGKER